MVISAEYDKIVPPERGLEVAEALNSRYELLKDAGHMMMVEKPKEIEDLIKDFIG
ncbi:alpha/beta fold hydrolase [uncultured Methanobrevibacter sp.]|uniref:alpha/beta fold hydrolase n=1 Tax=uncultured Methanobrevibacter sp. TaxID=253161 RepID=UPI0025F4AC93|nr:alpha/beta hydrolase [uncultured Methanobrevibacter sp.]